VKNGDQKAPGRILFINQKLQLWMETLERKVFMLSRGERRDICGASLAKSFKRLGEN